MLHFIQGRPGGTMQPSVLERFAATRLTAVPARKSKLIPWLLFAVFFCVYTLSLPVFSERFVSSLIFGADDMLDAYQGGRGRNLMEKHPLFIVVSGLYWLAGPLFSWAPADIAYNLRMVFPVALLGAVSVCVARLVFLRSGANEQQAVSFAVLYGVSGATWVFASFPETYMLTALCSNIFLWFILQTPRGPVAHHINRAAMLNALACCASPQQILLSLVPFVRWIGERQGLRSLIRRCVRYALAMLALYFIPYEIYLKTVGRGWKFGPVYLQVYGRVEHLLDPRTAAVVAKNFVLYSVVPPAVTPRYFTDPSLSILRISPWGWIVVSGLFVSWCVYSVRELIGSPALKPALAMAAFVCSYIVFFIYFNPTEAYLYTAPPLLAWLWILQGGFCRRWSRTRRNFLWLLTAAIVINNLQFRIYLQSIKLK
ncbi:MAG: hypothetical protein ABI806_00455 [Candidatus Solibacter sp.]